MQEPEFHFEARTNEDEIDNTGLIDETADMAAAAGEPAFANASKSSQEHQRLKMLKKLAAMILAGVEAGKNGRSVIIPRCLSKFFIKTGKVKQKRQK